jgi:replicative DNA helicase
MNNSKIADAILEAKILQTICESVDRGIILTQVDETWFTSDSTKEVYNRILTLTNVGKSVPSLSVLSCDQSISETARALLYDKSGVLTSEQDIYAAVDLLRVSRNRRIIMNTCLFGISKLGEGDHNLEKVMTAMESTLLQCQSKSDSANEMKHLSYKDRDQLLKEADETLSEQNNLDNIPSGFGAFDKGTGGFKRKNVIVLGSVPGGGKSAMALQMAIFQFVMGFNVCIVSYEMDISEIESRLFANVSKVNHSEINLRKLKNGKKELILKRYGEFLESTKSTNRLTLWTPQRELNINQIALELKTKEYDIIYIDYLSLLYQNPKKQMWENLGEHTRAAKVAASSLNAAMVLLAQYDDESNKIKYSSAIKANANFVWVWDYGDKEKETGIIEVKQLKARNSTTYPFYLETDYSVFSFQDYNGPTPVKDEDTNEDKPYKKKKFEKTNTFKSSTPQQSATIVNAPEAEKRGIPKMPQLF